MYHLFKPSRRELFHKIWLSNSAFKKENEANIGFIVFPSCIVYRVPVPIVHLKSHF